MLETSKWWPISCAGISISGPSSCCLGIQPADNRYLYPGSPDGPPHHEPAGSVVGGPTMSAVAAAGTGPDRTFHVLQSFVSWCGPITAVRQFKRTQDRLLWVALRQSRIGQERNSEPTRLLIAGGSRIAAARLTHPLSPATEHTPLPGTTDGWTLSSTSDCREPFTRSRPVAGRLQRNVRAAWQWLA